MLNIVLVEPQIPPNTGNIGRLCVNINATLHLVKPLGFDISEKALRRAGLDYWKKLDLIIWESLDEFLSARTESDRLHLLTTKASKLFWDVEYDKRDYLLFGSETRGLPLTLLEKYSSECVKIPMSEEGRSLNLSVSVGIVSYEALRQIRMKGGGLF